MLRKCISLSIATVLSSGILIAGQAVAQEKAAAPAAPQAKPTVAKVCANCHQPQPGTIRGNFDSVAYKTKSIQVKIDETTEILRFDDTVQIANVQAPADSPNEPLRALKKGKEVRLDYTEKDGKKFATAVIVKPAIKVAPEKLAKTEDIEKLVAQGPEKGKYMLIDARPLPRFQEGGIPTAVNIPFPAFEKMKDKLPADKSMLIVYYCAGVT
jgi:Rhodanese-like domain